MGLCCVTGAGGRLEEGEEVGEVEEEEGEE